MLEGERMLDCCCHQRDRSRAWLGEKLWVVIEARYCWRHGWGFKFGESWENIQTGLIVHSEWNQWQQWQFGHSHTQGGYSTGQGRGLVRESNGNYKCRGEQNQESWAGVDKLAMSVSARSTMTYQSFTQVTFCIHNTSATHNSYKPKHPCRLLQTHM